MYTIQVGNNGDLANVTLDPARYLGANNTMSNKIREQWDNYVNKREARVQVGASRTITLNHPSSNDITSLVYNDGAYKAGAAELKDIFDSILQQLQSAAFTPVTDSFGGEGASPLTYSDPIGQYMAVASVDSVELFGTTYKVQNNNNGTYSVVGGGTVNHPVYGTPVDVSKIVIKVATEGTGAKAKQTLTCQIPADILPVRVEAITYAADGSQTFTSNRGEAAALPLRLNYSVGFSEAVKTNGSVDLTKVSSEYKAAHRNANGGIDFYSNTYSATPESEPYADPKNPGTVGDATATFAPSKENRFYYFQANRTIYSSGAEGALDEVGSVDESTTLGSVSDLVDDKTYYLVIDYHEGGENPRLVNYVVARTGAELKNSVEVVDGVVKTKIGAPRLGNTNRFTEPKDGDATGTANATGTASLAYAPTYVYSDGEGSDYQVQVNLGNNGRVTVPATAVRIQKVVTAADGITAPDQEFTFTVTASGRSDGEETLPVFELRDDGSWAQSVDGSGNPVTQKVVWAGGTTTVRLKAGQSVLVEMADGVQWTVTEDELGSQPANGTFSLTGREGTSDAAATEDNGRQIVGTAAAGSVQQAIFTNAYTTSTTWTTGTHGSILLTKDMEGNLASDDPRGFRVGDHFSFEVSPNEGAPLPRADKADGSGDFSVTSVEVGVAAVNTETGDDGGQRTTYDLKYVYRGADGEVSSQMVREQGLSAFSASFPGIVFDRPGDYVYTVRESRATAQNVVAGVTYDPSVYRFTVQVGTDASGSKLQVSGVSVEKRGADSTEYQPVDGYGANDPVTFVNEYRTTDVRRFFGVTKTLTGALLAEGRFSFTLTGGGAHVMTDEEVAALPENGMTREQAAGYSYDGGLGQPMPDGVSGNTATTTNGAGGVVSFGGIRFEQASAYVGENPTADDLRRGVVYKYTVVENVPEGVTDNYLNGITYDTTSHDIYVYVHVEDSETEGEIVRSQVIYGHDHGTGGVDANSVPFVNSYEASGTNAADGTKTMNDRTFREGDTLTFTLSERAADTGVETVLQTKTLTVRAEDEGKNSLPVSFDPISYIHNGTKSDLGLHTYVLREVEPDEGKLSGVSYDTAPRVVTVNVTDNGNGTLTTLVTYPAGADAATWTNRYTAPTATVTLPGTKTFNGGPIPARSFGFFTWTTDETYRIEGVTPYQTWVGEGTSVDKDGTVTSTATVSNLLSSSSYKPGDYYFVIAENAGTSAGVSYDTARYQVHLTVTDNFDGTATPSLEVRKSTDGGNSWSEWAAPGEVGLAFTNTFEGVPQAVAQLSKVTLNTTVPADGYSFTLSIQRQDDSGQWVAAKASEVHVKGIDANADGTYSLKSDATGTISMGDLVFLREGTYRTALVEVLPNGDRVELGNGTAVVNGMAYDTHTASATYTVTRNGTSLVVRRDGADTLAFINDGGVPVSKTVYADGVEDAASLPQGPFTFTVSGLGDGQTAYLVIDGADEAIALSNDGTFKLSGGQSGRIYGLGQNGSIKLTESVQDGFTADSAELTGTAVSGADAAGMVFHNKYTPGAVKQQFSVSKELTGRGFKEGESFTFTLTGEGDAPMPTEDGRTATVRENNGTATFGEITYDKVGTYTYTVQEQAGDDADGLKHDRSVYTVSVDVTYDKETKALKSEATYTKGVQPYELVDGAMAFTNTYESTGKLTDDDAAKLDVVKTLTGRDMTDGQFTFAVEPVDTDDAKASEKLGAVELHSVAAKAGEAAKAVVTVDGEDKTLGDLLGAVTFTQADAGKTFSWTVSENGADKPAAGYTMDTAVYTASIAVTDNLDGTVKAMPSITKTVGESTEGADAVAFANEYNVTSVTLPVTDRVKVSKELSGRALKAGEFEFKLCDSEGNELATGTNAADGTVTFDRDLTFSAAGEYTYTVREVKGNLGGVTYDETVYSIVLTVTDNGNGTLSVSRKEGTPESVTFKNTYKAAEVTDTVVVAKTLEGRDMAEGEFTFQLLDEGGNVVATSTNDADGKATLGPISFDTVGDFEYTLNEVKGDEPGVTYDSAEYKVTFHVTDDGSGQLAVSHSIVDASGNTVEGTVAFNNTFTPTPVPSSVTDSIEVTKVLTGRDLKAGEFKFELVDGEGNVKATGTNDASGKVTMSEVEYTAPGVHEYTLCEVVPSGEGDDVRVPGVGYDGQVYRVRATVTLDTADGTLSVTHSLLNVDGDPVEGGITFTNRYTPEPVTTSVTDTITVNKTMEGRALEAGEFKFELVDGEGSVKATGTNDADGKVVLGSLTYDKVGEHKYTLREVVPAEGDKQHGIGYDGTIYTVVVTVADDGNGKLVATYAIEGSSDTTVTFKNTYTPEPIHSSVTENVTVTKDLSGRDLKAGEFKFELVDGKGDVVATGANDADGKVTMDAVEYTKTGTYEYTLRETNNGIPGMSYDPKTYKVTVEVTADPTTGALSAASTFDAESVVFSNTYNADAVSDYVAVTKTLDGRQLQAGEFTFQVADGAGAVVATATNGADGKATLGPINFTKAGTYTYTVSEVEPAENKLAGVTYDGRTYDVTFTVTDDGSGQLAVTHVVQGAEDNVAAFKNTFTPDPIGYSVTSSVDVTKMLTGRDLRDGEFGFELVDGEGNVKATGTNDASGKVTMGEVRYTEPGEYRYTLRETVPDDDRVLPGVSYDKTTYDVAVTVKADVVTGALSAEAVVAGGPAVFTNAYKADAANTTLSASKQLTGRDFLEGETFSFTLAAQDGAPMPAAGGETATVSENLQQAAFGAITFTAPGEYRYTVSEVGGGSTKDGVAYDGSTFTAVVTVKDDTRTGRLEATVAYQNVDGATVTIPSFINRYTSTGSMDGVASVNVSKVLTGRPMAAGQFAFSVTPADDASAAKLPAQTLTNQASDTSGTPAAVVTAEGETLSELFSGVTFTEADAGKTFAWTVAETSEAAPGYTVDATTYRVEVKVADNGNGTIAATTYVNGDAVTGGHALIAFKNGYRAESDPDAAEGSGRVTTTKAISNRDLVADEFTFQMRDASGAVDFGAVRYTSEQALADVAFGVATQVGTADKPVYRYTYTLSEVTDALPENVSAEVPTVTVAVDVADNGDGTMTCSVVWPSDGASTGFVNAYEADPLPVTISGTKVFTAPEGLSVPDSVYGAFTFTLTDEAGNVLGTVTNDRSGSVAFPEITYTQDDLAGEAERTFTYTVTETGSVPGVTNDVDATRTVTVHLSQGKDGHLSTRVEGLPFTFTNTYSVEELTTSVTDQVKVTKTLTGRTLADGEFEFRLVGEDGEVAASGTNAADGTVTLSPVTYIEPGTYTYTLSEVQGDKPGVGYDDAVYTVTTTVVDDGDGTLSATHEVTGGEAVFNNTFTPSSVVDPDFGIPARKILVGRDWRDDDAFNFVVTAETENAPMPDPSSVFATAGSPMVHFGAVAFSEPGEYSYLVSEVAGDEEGMTYSQAVYRVRYEVTTDPVTGELQLDVHIHRIRGDAGADAADEWPFDVPLEFVNTYEAPEEPVVPEQPDTPEQPAGPVEKLPEPVKAVVLPITGLIAKTGDVVAPLLPWIGAGAAAVTTGVLRILKGGRRRED